MADGSMWEGFARRSIVVMQTEAAECGLACLAMILRHHGKDHDLPSLRRSFGASLRGVNLVRLIEIADALGMDAKPLRTEVDYLRGLQSPAILHWDHNHFVVLDRVRGHRARIHDPARGAFWISLEDLGRHYTGILLELRPRSDFTKTRARTSISLSRLIGQVHGIKGAFVQVLGLALAIEVLGLLIPFHAQWVLDHVLASQDVRLLVALGVGFLLIVIVQTGLAIARAHAISWLGASINVQWIGNLFSHLMRLPMAFFERRHLGDIVSRFSSAHMIQATVTGSFVEGLLDGVFGLFALALLLAYDAWIAAIVAASAALYLAARWATSNHLRRLNEEQLVHGARQQSELMESCRGIQAIKLANLQGVRSARLHSATAAASGKEMQAQKITLVFAALNNGVNHFQRLLIVSVGCALAIRGEMSAGMLVAVMVYADQFATKSASLVDKLMQLRIVGMHADRLADIALEPPEDEGRHVRMEPAAASVEATGLGFRYGPDEPWVFRNLDFRIADGEHVAIVGPSGSGKTTLAKVLLGLLPPTEGRILVGGIDSRHAGLKAHRAQFAAVMQDDTLFAGSIAQNICFFDPAADDAAIARAAELAGIADDIGRMPMRYETLVGDMGSSLSGGQRQRVMIARALYRNARIVLFDEATSHLDQAREHDISSRIAGLGMTRIVIAHRPETIASTDRTIVLSA